MSFHLLILLIVDKEMLSNHLQIRIELLYPKSPFLRLEEKSSDACTFIFSATIQPHLSLYRVSLL